MNPQPQKKPSVLFPPQSPEETTDPETFALATAIGIRLTRLGYSISEMDAIALAEDVTEYFAVKTKAEPTKPAVP